MTVASGTRRGSADSTPSTSVQMMISAASSSAPKIEPEKSLPLRPSVVCTPRRSWAMKPVMISVPVKSGRHQRGEVARATPPTARPGPSEPHSTTTTRRASIHCTAPARPRALLEEALEQPRRPDLAVAGDQIAHRARGRAGELHGVQDPLRGPGSRGRSPQGTPARWPALSSSVGDRRVARAQLRELAAVGARPGARRAPPGAAARR